MVITVHNVIVSSEARYQPNEVMKIVTEEIKKLSPAVCWRFSPDALTHIVSYQIRTRDDARNRANPLHQAFASGFIGIDWGGYKPPKLLNDWLRLFEPGAFKQLNRLLSRSQVAFLSEPIPWPLPKGSYVLKNPWLFPPPELELQYRQRQLTKPPLTIEGKVVK